MGKSAIAINLAVALQQYGFRTLIVDLDMINPSVGLYLGMESVNIGAVEAIQRKIDIRSAIVPHTPSGLRVLPGKVESKYIIPTTEDFEIFFKALEQIEYDYIIVDTQPGIPSTEVLSHYDEALLISLPDEASCISAVKLLKQYSEEKEKSSIIVNRMTSAPHELTIREIEELCESKVTTILPEDINVKRSIADHIPLFLLNKHSPFSEQINALAQVYAARSGLIRQPQEPPKPSGGPSFLDKFFKKK